MNITIASPNGENRTIELSPAMQKHWSEPINHAQTILDQINNGMYERWFKGKENLNVIDFGANVGLTALYFYPAINNMLCVEPTPSHAALLNQLIYSQWTDKNHPLPVLFSNCALSQKEEELIFMTGHSTENKITSADGYGNGKITVHGKPLKYFVDLFGSHMIIDFIKCDVEGAEINALTTENIEAVAGKVKTFFVECHPSNNYGMDACREELKARFEKCGYEVEVLDYQTIVATNKAL